MNTEQLKSARMKVVRRSLLGVYFLLCMVTGWYFECTVLFAAEPEQEIQQYIQDLRHENYQVRWKALEGLAKLGPKAEPAVPALVEAMNNEYDRYRAVNVLGDIGPSASPAVPALVERLNFILGNKDYRDRVTESAGIIDTLAKIGSEARAAITVLRMSLKDENSHIRYEAAHALGEMGPEAKVAIPDLEAVLDDKEYVPLYVLPYGKNVGEAAARSLKKLRGHDPSLTKDE